MKISDNTSVSMPMRNLLSIVGACIVGAWFGFGVIERLNIIETELQLMQQDLLEASTEQDKLKEKIETEVPNIKKNDMTIQFHEERIIDLEEKNGYHD